MKSWMYILILVIIVVIVEGLILYNTKTINDISNDVVTIEKTTPKNKIDNFSYDEELKSIILVPVMNGEVVYGKGNQLLFKSEDNIFYITQSGDRYGRFDVKDNLLLYSMGSRPGRDYPSDHIYDLKNQKEIFKKSGPYLSERDFFTTIGDSKTNYFSYCYENVCDIYTINPFEKIHENSNKYSDFWYKLLKTGDISKTSTPSEEDSEIIKALADSNSDLYKEILSIGQKIDNGQFLLDNATWFFSEYGSANGAILRIEGNGDEFCEFDKDMEKQNKFTMEMKDAIAKITDQVSGVSIVCTK